MSVEGLKNIPMSFPQSDIEQLKSQKPSDLETEKARLAKATKEFESFFMYQLMKSMRKTIPESSFGGDGGLSSGMGKDIFTDMFDMELSNKMSNSGHNSISSMLYRSLEKTVEAPYLAKEKDVVIKPLKLNKSQQIKVEDDKKIKIERKPDQIKLEKKPSELMPISTSLKNIKNDEVLSRFGSFINEAAKDTSLDPALIISVIRAESDGNPNAVSSAGAKGLMQLIDSTAREYGVNDVFDPRENILGGCRYLKNMYDRFGNVKLALAAYNAGPGNVMRYNGIPPFKETRNYVNKVIDSLNVITGINNSDPSKEVD